jgi:RES domain-containing protein
LIESLDPATLHSDWRESPAPSSLQLIGDDWISRGSSVVLSVPSAIIDTENNYLINPAHKNFKKLMIGKMEMFKIDHRLRTQS